MPLPAAICFLLGPLLGPLLGVLVDRSVDRETPEPFLRCPRCSQRLPVPFPVPVVSWFARCPNNHRSWRYPVIDLGAGVLFAIAGWTFGWSWQLVPYLIFFAMLAVMSVVDIEHKLLLDIFTFPALFFGLFVVLALSGPNDFEAGIAPALWAGGLYFVFFFLANRIYPPGMGLGDVKLAPSLGLFLGWLADDSFRGVQITMTAILIGLLSGAVIGMIAQRSRKAEVPFGPFMVLGAVAMIAITTPAGV